eukprot:3759756-Prymnesium_polylepis.1
MAVASCPNGSQMIPSLKALCTRGVKHKAAAIVDFPKPAVPQTLVAGVMVSPSGEFSRFR